MLTKIPKLSQPLAKSIRTLEGVLVLVANVALVIISIVSSSLSAGQAVKYGVILNAAYAVGRSLLKGIAAAGSFGAPTPAEVVSPATEAEIVKDAGALATEAVKVFVPQSAIKPDGPVATPASPVGPAAPVPVAAEPATPGA